MKRNEVTRDAASAALIALRKAMVLTQQRFAVEVLKTSIGTVGRYESNGPPQGDALLRLGHLASAHGQHAIASLFEFLYMEETLKKLSYRMMSSPATET